ncbi:hypothetical protein M422DRAFT_273586 [Sphaerobolus stellatus SS14]|uniref:Unplaced genomic scaffold SPHSTscaffold_339, whole genome shotgun sequence n=1 Tax=Sphaerobolus stellatus (strain SS14) TaxID=990650 RepID=A0A0C9TUF2_SPHS4|nr:hypothetical protein M422DRAFT_273586 [Sphaerobolus stellatus SS14]
MAPKRKTVDKVPAGTGDVTDSGSTSNVIGGNNPTLDPGKDPSQTVSAVSETNMIRPTTQSIHVANQLAQPVSEQGMSENPTQIPNPHRGSGDPPLLKTYSDYSEPSERLALADPDPEELALGNQIQEMLNTINEHMDEVKSIHNMSRQAAQLLHALSKVWTELSAKTAVLKQLYADQAPEGHLNQAATAARNTCMEYKRLLRLSKARLLKLQDRHTSIPPSENAREEEIQDKPRKSVQYTPFNSIEDEDTDSETTVRNPREGSVPFQHPDKRGILDMSNNESDNALIRMAGVKVTPPDKYSRKQSFEALETFVKGLLRWLDMHSMLGPEAYKYQVSFLGTRLEGKALEWFDKTVKPRKYQGTPMDLEQVVTGLYSQYIPSLARHEVSNKFDLIKKVTLSVQEFATELKLYVSRMIQ